MNSKSEGTIPTMVFRPGKSGNPKGRPAGFKGLAKKVRAATSDGDELVDFAMSVFRGEHEACISFAHRMEAWKWLADRGWGKAPVHVEINAQSDAALTGPDLSQLTDEQLDILDKAGRVLEDAHTTQAIEAATGKKVIDV
jgi:hypothetical protein